MTALVAADAGFETRVRESFSRLTLMTTIGARLVKVAAGECFMGVLPAPERPAFVGEVREALRPRLCDARGRWTADYVLLRFAATRSLELAP